MKLRIIHIVALAMLFLVLGSCGDNRIANNPSSIADEAGLNLPSYTIVSQADNMDRGASAWSEYTWELKLNEPFTTKSIDELNQLVKTPIGRMIHLCASTNTCL